MSKAADNTIRERFEREAQSFDSIYRLERSPFWRWFNTTFRKACFIRYDATFEEAGDVTGKSILDVGCGSGVYSVDFARRGARRVLGVDFSGNMLELARREAETHACSEVCTFVQSDFMTFEPDELFDVSIAMGVFDYVLDPRAFLHRMARLTRGKVIVSIPGHSPVRERARRLRYQLLSKGHVFFYSEEEVRRIVRDAGITEYKLLPIAVSGTGFILVAQGLAK